jgi:formylglycine-generating enzyme required for sulfatase activity
VYFLLTGKRPKAIREKDVPDAWRELVFKSLEESPADRYASMDAFAATLCAIGSSTPRTSVQVQGGSFALASTAAPSRQSVSNWATVLYDLPDPKIIKHVAVRERISSLGLPWRVKEIQSGIEMVLIPPGRYMRGASPNDKDAREAERPAHQVVITKAFYLGAYEVTQGEWLRLMGPNPSHFKGDRLPVECVSWDDAQEFLRRSNGLRLPTEGEWEYACRAGVPDARYGDLRDIAWNVGNSAASTHPVGEKQANSFGLHDMLGNVWEWCSDWSFDYEPNEQTDPTGPRFGFCRLARGGSWRDGLDLCRASARKDVSPSNSLDLDELTMENLEIMVPQFEWSDSGDFMMGLRVARNP